MLLRIHATRDAQSLRDQLPQFITTNSRPLFDPIFAPEPKRSRDRARVQAITSMENMMRISLTLTSQTGSILDSCTTIMLAHTLLTALGELMWRKQRLTLHSFIPRVLDSSIVLEGEPDLSSDMFDGIAAEFMRRITHASDLLMAAEMILRSELADRMLQPAARLPVRVKHAPTLSEILAYDQKEDTILCQISDWKETA